MGRKFKNYEESFTKKIRGGWVGGFGGGGGRMGQIELGFGALELRERMKQCISGENDI